MSSLAGLPQELAVCFATTCANSVCILSMFACWSTTEEQLQCVDSAGVVQLQQACLLAELLLAVMLQHFSESDGDPIALSKLGDNRVRPFPRHCTCFRCMYTQSCLAFVLKHADTEWMHARLKAEEEAWLLLCFKCYAWLQAFLSLQRVLDPTLDYLMRGQTSKSQSTEAVQQMARELRNYMTRAIRSWKLLLLTMCVSLKSLCWQQNRHRSFEHTASVCSSTCWSCHVCHCTHDLHAHFANDRTLLVPSANLDRICIAVTFVRKTPSQPQAVQTDHKNEQNLAVISETIMANINMWQHRQKGKNR